MLSIFICAYGVFFNLKKKLKHKRIQEVHLYTSVTAKILEKGTVSLEGINGWGVEGG